jgi:hypothetical protein
MIILIQQHQANGTKVDSIINLFGAAWEIKNFFFFLYLFVESGSY